MTKYFVMMSIRVACFVLMVVIQPIGWYTWVLALGAIFLPYFAVVVANVSSATSSTRAVPPERALPAAPAAAPAEPKPETTVIRIEETGQTPRETP